MLLWLLFIIEKLEAQLYVIAGQISNFDIDSATGWISVKSSLDRDAADVSQSGGVYALYVKVGNTVVQKHFQCYLSCYLW